MELIETVTSTKTAFSGKIFSVDHMEVTLPDGANSIRQVVRNPGASAIVALDERGAVAMVRQYRIAARRVMLEIPAGKLDPGEDPLLCAQRELTEETGLIASNWQKLTAMFSSPGFCDEVLHLYLATGLTPGESNPDEGEFLTLSWIPLDELLSMIATGELTDGKSIAAILLTAQLLKQK